MVPFQLLAGTVPTEPQKVRVDTGTWTGIETVVAIGIEIEVAIGIESEPDTVDAIGTLRENPPI